MELLISILLILIIISIASLIKISIYGYQGQKGNMSKLFNELEGLEEKNKKPNKIKKGIRTMSSKQFIMLFIPVGFLAFTSAFIFFRSFTSALVIMIFSMSYPYLMLYKKKKKLKLLLNYQLKDALNALQSSLKAGSSLNNALVRTFYDLDRIFLNERNKPIVDEFRIVSYELDLMIPVDEVLINLKTRCQLEDVTDLVNVMLITRKQGGNLSDVIDRVSEIIGDRIQIEREINTLVAGKKMEAKILTVLPIILVLVLSIISPEYMKPLYETSLGKLLMVFATVLLVINYYIGKKIIEIEV